MRELTIHDLDVELLPARELMGCMGQGRTFTCVQHTSIYNQGSGDGNGNFGLFNVLNGSGDGNNILVGGMPVAA
jgi:hypothetical protein